MLLIIFLLLLTAVLSAWLGRRKLAMTCFFVMLTLASIYFYHHLTTHLSLML
jgi:positive regulator of sigma E activity